MQFLITYDDAATETVEADRVSITESTGQVLFHREVVVMNRPREIVCRRISGNNVRDVSQA